MEINNIFANSFSAEFLVPEDELKQDIGDLRVFDREIISEFPNSYAVSKQVIMLRLLSLRYILERQYDDFRQSFDAEKLEKLEHGRRNWDKVFFNRIGYFAQQEVGKAYHKGEISFSEVIGVFDIKSKYAEKLVT